MPWRTVEPLWLIPLELLGIAAIGRVQRPLVSCLPFGQVWTRQRLEGRYTRPGIGGRRAGVRFRLSDEAGRRMDDKRIAELTAEVLADLRPAPHGSSAGPAA